MVILPVRRVWCIHESSKLGGLRQIKEVGQEDGLVFGFEPFGLRQWEGMLPLPAQ
ncbi:hypothetical protein [Sinorhizobium americanum]|uniref:Uncharacterized protein n=1 Tax=Sinorhizobium americanum TaxID=194963 RepID=A0A4R2B1Z2_9HYPH|nr:hypothetical protein [Sinorhizobium americanum]TCN19279.1 hypothetical protein EV184_13126 [Sinorhizobium americanum]